jgi:hypothetical protein
MLFREVITIYWGEQSYGKTEEVSNSLYKKWVLWIFPEGGEGV